MKHRIAFGVLAVALVAGTAFSQAPAGKRPLGEGLQRADTNHDGKVSFEEMKAVRPQITPERFNMLDRNHDGFISPADRAEGGKIKGVQGTGAKGAAAADPDARSQMLTSLLAADSNHDGKVSFEEVVVAKPGFGKTDFDRLDRNHDGFISAQDMPSGPAAGASSAQTGGPARGGGARGPEMRAEVQGRMRAADTNGDGYVSREEARKAFPGMTDERFKAMDRNGDGKIGPGDRPTKLGSK